MFTRCCWCCLAACLSLNVAVFSRIVMASPVDEFVPGFAIALQHETVSDTVGYSPNLQTGGFANAVQKPRFQAHGFTLSYSPDRRTHYHFTLRERQMNSLRDAFVINEISTGLSRRFQLKGASRYTLGMGVNASVNHSPEIYKNSYTNYADHLITEVRLIEPRDARLSVSADITLELTSRLRMTVALNGGLSQTSQKEVQGSARLDNDCRYAFNASTQGGSVRQLERCGELISYEQSYPTNQALNDRLGFSVADDLTYRDYFLGPQVSVGWRQGAWAIETGYAFRQYLRPMLDQRMRDAGDTPVTKSHSGYANASVDVFSHWKIDARVGYQRAAFLDDVPFLYNALTHERYSGKGVIRYALTITRHFD